ncbi:MAG: cupin domain-containing protein [Janthinobacterium lividum]
MIQPETYHFSDDGRFPNSVLPLLVYRSALLADAASIKGAFQANGWSNSWRDGIFSYHHFHSIAHEVLGIAAGAVDVAFGGPGGRTVKVQAGDVVVIPAGVSHRNMGQTGDLLVIGAYPGGADYDTRRGDPCEHDQMLRNIAAVNLPPCDPVSGRDGSLRSLWTNASRKAGSVSQLGERSG